MRTPDPRPAPRAATPRSGPRFARSSPAASTLRSLAVALLLALGLGLAACGGTLYTAEGLPPLPDGGGTLCGASQTLCFAGTPQEACYDLTSDLVNCGACGHVCAASPPAGTSAVACQASQCRYACSPGFLNAGTSGAPVCVPGVQVAVGSNHSCALLGDGAGTLKCWGDNTQGQVTGAPTSGRVLDPATVRTGVDLVVAAATHTCARVAGVLQCWGAGGTAVPSPQPPNVVQLVAGESHTCALSGSGGPAATAQVTCWGTGAAAAIPAGFLPASVVGIAAGRAHTCAVDGASPSAWCWGLNDQGQLGSSAVGATQVVRSLAAPAAVLGAGWDATCAAAPRALDCWGSVQDQAAAQKVNFDVDAISVGRFHICIHKAAEGLKCFGDDSLGQLGVAVPLVGEPSDVPPATFGAYAFAAGMDHTCAVFPPEVAGGVTATKCWGRNDTAQLGRGDTVQPAAGTVITVSGR